MSKLWRKTTLSAGQYFDVKVEYVEIDEETFKRTLSSHKENLKVCFLEGRKLEDNIAKSLEELIL